MQSRRAALANLSALVASLTASPLLQAAGASARMPSIFIGHGSPMNAISRNSFTDTLAAWGKRLPRPRAIVVVSAHWLSRGATGVTSNPAPPTIHDFSGFPRELQEMTYPAKGDPRLAREIASLIRSQRGVPTTEWGLDHGTWTVLHHLFPGAPVPVLQVSIDYDQGAAFHLAIGRELAALREKGVLVVGSGNIVHNLRMTRRGVSAIQAYDWAIEFDKVIAGQLQQGELGALAGFQSLGTVAQMSHPTWDHYLPLLHAAGAADAKDPVRFFNANYQSASISMRSVVWG